MVYIHFPSNLTDEELMLQAKYNKLRKKKKAVQEMKVPKPEPEKANPLKRPLDPKDAKEMAKKLIQSGKVSLPFKKPIEKKSFKRPRTLERKILSTGRSEGHGGLTPGYQANYPNIPDSSAVQFEPFTPNPNPPGVGEGAPGPPGDRSDLGTKSGNSKGKNRFKGSGSFNQKSSGFVSSSAKKHFNEGSSSKRESNDFGGGNNSGGGQGSSPKIQVKPKRGPTIYVQAQNITEPVLKEQFEKYGKIVNVKLNNQAVGFITYDKVESAETAIQEMNGMTIDDISYDVQFARRQPNITQLINDASASASWTALATSNSQKSNFQDRRQQVVYDDTVEPMEIQ